MCDVIPVTVFFAVQMRIDDNARDGGIRTIIVRCMEKKWCVILMAVCELV